MGDSKLLLFEDRYFARQIQLSVPHRRRCLPQTDVVGPLETTLPFLVVASPKIGEEAIGRLGRIASAEQMVSKTSVPIARQRIEPRTLVQTRSDQFELTPFDRPLLTTDLDSPIRRVGKGSLPVEHHLGLDRVINRLEQSSIGRRVSDHVTQTLLGSVHAIGSG